MRRLLFLACAVVFLDVSFFAVLTPLLPDYRHDFGLSTASAGVLSGSYAAGTLAMSLPGGWFAARFGPRNALLVGLVGVGLFSPLFGFANAIWLLDLCRFVQGAAGALMWAGAMSWVVTSGRDDERGGLVGTMIGAAVVGELLGAPLGALAHVVGTKVVFGAVFFAAAVLFVIAYTIPAVESEATQTLRVAVATVRRANIWPAIWLLAAPSFAFGLTLVVAPLRMNDLGASPILIAAAFASGSLIEALFGPVIGRYSDRVGRTGPYQFGVAVTAVSIAVIGVFANLPIIFTFVVLIAFGAALVFTPATTLVTDVAAEAGLNQGYASGAANAAWGGGQMVGAFGGGLLASVAFVLPCLVTVFVLGAVALVAGRIDERPPADESQVLGR